MTVNSKKMAFGIIVALACVIMLLQTKGRVFWPYVIANYVIAMGVYFWEFRKHELHKKPGLWRYLFPKDIWGHSSTLNDSLLALINFCLFQTILSIGFFSSKFYIEGAHALVKIWPPVNAANPETAGWPVLVGFTFASMLAAEFCYYWYHRISHKIPALWEFHKVHHSAQVMTPISVYRLHPVDFWLTNISRTIGVAIMDVIFWHYYPGVENVILMSGVNIIIVGSSVLGGVLHHSHVWLSFGPLERFLISPAQHQVHHSNDVKHYDRNFGAVFAIWDWMFGSIYLTRAENENINLGLGHSPEKDPYRDIEGMLLQPFRHFIRRFKKRLGSKPAKT